MDIRAWWSEGELVELSGHRVWMRRWGSGPPLTLLHGFPSSSHDFWKIAPALAERHELIALDLLGFGASDKPADHDYSIVEQVDLVEALWAREGITATSLVGHDYSVSLVQELLARRAEGALAVEITAAHLLNGGVYPDVHRPTPAQLVMADPEQGPQLSAAMTEELFVAGLRETFGPAHDTADEDGAQIWASIAHGGVVLHRTIAYMAERREHAARWTGALETTDVPLCFVWGMLDPISGAHMAERIRERVPDAPLVALDDVGHWPSLEAPDRVAAAILGGA